MNKLQLIGILLLFSLGLKAQQNGGFAWTISECCVRIEINEEIVSNYPFWKLRVGTKIYDETTDPDGIIEICFTKNGNYLTILSASPNSYGELIKITECNTESNNGFSLFIDDCCVKVTIINNGTPKRNWILSLGDGTTVTRQQNNNSDVVTHCYQSTGSFEIKVLYETGGGASTFVEILECKSPCILSSLCWEDFMSTMECAKAVRLTLPNGAIVEVPFSVINNAPNICNDPLFQNPIPESIPVVGGHCEIATQIIKAITDLGYDVDFAYTDPLNRPDYACNKAGVNNTVGFFFMSIVKVEAILGGSCNELGINKDKEFKSWVDCP
jgi:hypothetical protein